MGTSTVHVVFNLSAEGLLRRALKATGCNERVVGLMDCLSFGPINPPDPQLRAQWVGNELGYTGWQEVAAESDIFWSEALSTRDRKIVWMSRRSAQEFAGFLEWLWRLGDAPFECVDMADVVVRATDEDGLVRLVPAVSLAHWRPELIIEDGVLDRPQAMAPALRERYRELWRRLRAENAPLRILDESGLVSAPLSFFDSLLLSQAAPEWEKAARIVGRAAAESLETSFVQTGDLMLASRVRSLVAAGQLQGRGDMADIRQSEVRLPNGNKSRSPD